jgi:ketosteroid isomerase-like protein
LSNPELVRATYEAFNRDGVDAFGDLLASETLWQEHPRTGEVNPATPEEVLSRMRPLLRVEPEELFDGGDRVVAVVRESPRGDGGERVRTHVWTIRDGEAVRLGVYRNRVDAIRSVFGYYRLLERLHAYLRPRTYVEIGVRNGRSLAYAAPGTKIIGIDPEPDLTDPAIASSVEVFRCTSDDFFANHDLSEALDGRPVDLAFIDGLHLFEYALRDFMHLERHCSERSVILVHDCYPIDRSTAGREPVPGDWSGDVWKLVACLLDLRPDLKVNVVDVHPSGLGIVTNLDPGSTLLTDAYEEIVERFVPLEFNFLPGAQEERLARVDNDWDVIRSLLAGSPLGGSRVDNPRSAQLT